MSGGVVKSMLSITTTPIKRIVSEKPRFIQSPKNTPNPQVSSPVPTLFSTSANLTNKWSPYSKYSKVSDNRPITQQAKPRVKKFWEWPPPSHKWAEYDPWVGTRRSHKNQFIRKVQDQLKSAISWSQRIRKQF